MNELSNKVKARLREAPSFKKVVVAVSGGMDSVVLAHVLKNLGYEVIIAHLNHQLRGEASDQDEAWVIELAKKWELPYLTKKAVIPKEKNLENQARHLRYAFLEDVRESYMADFIAVGHHFDDQIETVLMHERRGSGLRGKRGMMAINGKILRPMIDASRNEIEAYANKYQLDYRLDGSNIDLSFERNHLRLEIIPELKKEADFEDKIRNACHEARLELEKLDAEKNQWVTEHVKNDRFSRVDFNALETNLKVEILLDILGQEDVYKKTLDRLISFISSGKTGKEVQVKTCHFVVEYDQLRWHRGQSIALEKTELSKDTQWGNYTIKVSNIKPLYVRSWKAGDRFRPQGMKGSKKLQDFFVDQKIPKYDRRQIPVIVNEDDDIMCIGNLRFSESGKVLEDQIDIQQN